LLERMGVADVPDHKLRRPKRANSIRLLGRKIDVMR
jgi:hypothetical protein